MKHIPVWRAGYSYIREKWSVVEEEQKHILLWGSLKSPTELCPPPNPRTSLAPEGWAGVFYLEWRPLYRPPLWRPLSYS